MRRAVETAPELFDGGVDWEGTFVDEDAPNLLTDLPPAVLNFPDYVASGFTPTSTAAKNILAAGYPPDIVVAAHGATSLWVNYSNSFWEVTQCQWQKRLDPTYDTYVSGTGTLQLHARLSPRTSARNMADFATTGDIQRPLITVAGTMDALLPIDHHARAYARKVEARGRRRRRQGNRDDRKKRPAYRLYEVQNGNHIETYQDTFPQLELIKPHAQQRLRPAGAPCRAGVALPPDQCIPRGGAITDTPAQAGSLRKSVRALKARGPRRAYL